MKPFPPLGGLGYAFGLAHNTYFSSNGKTVPDYPSNKEEYIGAFKRLFTKIREEKIDEIKKDLSEFSEQYYSHQDSHQDRKNKESEPNYVTNPLHSKKVKDSVDRAKEN